MSAKRPEDEFYFDIEKHAQTLNGKVDEFSGVFGETWSQLFVRGIDEAKDYQSIFNLVNLTDSICTINGKPSYAGKGAFEKEEWEKWSTISKLINRKYLRNIDRDLIFTELRTWDHHKQIKGGLRSQLRALNNGLEMFVKQTKASGLWDNVTVVIASNFGRTFIPNSNEGTDHGWGGHYMILGGDVEGGRILGEYPLISVRWAT